MASELSVGVSYAAALSVTSAAPPSDATSLIQAAINSQSSAGCGSVYLPAGVWNVSGLSLPSNVGIRGDGPQTVIHITANAAAINAAGVSNISIRDLTITGTGANYTGYGTGPGDTGQVGIHLSGCANVVVSNVFISNISGVGINYENAPSGFNVPNGTMFDGISAAHCFKGIWTHNSGEYANWTNIQVHNCVFGAHIESANNVFSGGKSVFCSIGIKVNGLTTAGNYGHGVFSGWESNHNTYNMVAMDLQTGYLFDGCHFIGGQAGGISTGETFQIYNCRGVSIIGGHLGCNVVIGATSPATSSSAYAGANLLSSMFVRDDLANFAAPSIGYTGGLLVKGNYTASGLWSANN